MLNFANIRNIVFLLLVILFSSDSVENSENSQIKEFFKSGITFGFQWDGVLFGDPEFVDPEYDPDNDESLQKYLDDNFPGIAVIIENPLVNLPSDFIETKINDSPGDTVMIIQSSGKFYATIEKIQYLYLECEYGIRCILSPLDREMDVERISREYVILRKDKFYNGRITPYRKYDVYEPSYMAIIDSAIKKMANMAKDFEGGKLKRIYNNKSGEIYRFWLEDRQDPFYPFPFIIINSKAYGVEEKDTPDTLFVAITASLVANTSYGWASLLEIYREGNSWRSKEILGPHPGLKFRIICSFDLNTDDTPEYFVFTWDGALYAYIDGKLELVAYAKYRGC
jgi:hypothetical protein